MDSGRWFDSDGGRGLALAVDGHEDRELLVGVASDLCCHGALLWAQLALS